MDKHAHTPGPWSTRGIPEDDTFDYRYSDWVDGPHGMPIADIRRYDDKESEANAAFIVRACNSHAELVAALEKSRLWVAMYLNAPGHGDAAASMIRVIDSALARAKS